MKVLIRGVVVVVPVVDAKAPQWWMVNQPICARGTWKYHVFYECEKKKMNMSGNCQLIKGRGKRASSEVNPQLFFQFN